jgi:hypothetical protein
MKSIVPTWKREENTTRENTKVSVLQSGTKWRNNVEQCGTTWNNVEQRGTMWNNVERCGTMCVEQCGTMWSNVEQCGTMWNNVVQRLQCLSQKAVYLNFYDAVRLSVLNYLH